MIGKIRVTRNKKTPSVVVPSVNKLYNDATLIQEKLSYQIKLPLYPKGDLIPQKIINLLF